MAAVRVWRGEGQLPALHPQVPAACVSPLQHSLLAEGSQHVVWALLEQHAVGRPGPLLVTVLPLAGLLGLVARKIAEEAAA